MTYYLPTNVILKFKIIYVALAVARDFVPMAKRY